MMLSTKQENDFILRFPRSVHNDAKIWFCFENRLEICFSPVRLHKDSQYLCTKNVVRKFVCWYKIALWDHVRPHIFSNFSNTHIFGLLYVAPDNFATHVFNMSCLKKSMNAIDCFTVPAKLDTLIDIFVGFIYEGNTIYSNTLMMLQMFFLQQITSELDSTPLEPKCLVLKLEF